MCGSLTLALQIMKLLALKSGDKGMDSPYTVQADENSALALDQSLSTVVCLHTSGLHRKFFCNNSCYFTA